MTSLSHRSPISRNSSHCLLIALALLATTLIGCSSIAEPSNEGAHWVQVSAELQHACGVLSNGATYCWGNNQDSSIRNGVLLTNVTGQLGTGRDEDSPSPARVASTTAFSSVSAGFGKTCALSYAKNAFCWGGNIGLGSSDGSKRPVMVASSMKFDALASGAETCGVIATGDVYCWGLYNASPTRVETGAALRTVTGGGQPSCGLTTGGAAYCWGFGSNLGDGVFSPAYRIAAVSGGYTFTSIASRNSVACGLTAAGKVMCWGRFISWNQLVPVELATDVTFASLSGAEDGCALTEDGRAYCWDESFKVAPMQPSMRFKQISSSGDYWCGLTLESDLYCWGRNFYGTLGVGDHTDRSTPTLIPVP